MKKNKWVVLHAICVVAAILAAVCLTATARAQQSQESPIGVVDDWTHHHLIFSDPGTLMNATMNGRREEWQRIMNDPRYRLQQIKRNAASTAQTGDSAPSDSEGGSSIKRDWSVTVSTAGASVAIGMYPAKYTFAPIAAPSCTNDFVVFPISSAGSKTRANIVGVTNLYKGTCGGTVPTVMFAYYVGTGRVRTSPVLSLDGSKVAFVESRTTGASIFHVLKMDKSGNSGCATLTTPCNGSSFDGPPAVPGTNNSASDMTVPLSGTGNVAVTRSSPYVDYTNDVAYVGDNNGNLHKFTNVFNGNPAEAGTPWPVTVASGVVLTGPTYDSVSGNIFIGGNDGNLYCVTSAGAFCSTKSIAVGNGTGTAGAILDAPIVDSTTHMVFVAANNATDAILSQSTTSLGSQIRVTMGKRGNNLYNGAFDNLYFTSTGTGHMYFCGNATGSATPTLWRVGFSSTGTINATNDGSSFTLADKTGVNCAPLTEVYNSGTTPGVDYLFLGVNGGGFDTGTPNCGGTACLVSFILPSSGNSVPTKANATMTSIYTGTTGPSGIIVDNVSGMNGAAQIYFGAPTMNLGVQASQAGLQ
jgi:hypothetical protein